MFDCSDIVDLFEDNSADPRLNEEFLRCLGQSRQRGTVLLVGVVHDHPASVFRAGRILESVSTDVLAVELPPLAVSLFELYSRDSLTPPRLGGEMSMAIKAVDGVDIVGIDAPNWSYLRTLLKAISTEAVSKGVAWRLLKDFGSGLAHAVACRCGAILGTVTPIRLRLYSHIEYDCSLLDPPTDQAEHEAAHVSQRQAFLRAIQPPPAIERIDELRETDMASRLNELRRTGDVVAIVGIEHLDSLETKLQSLSESDSL